jgi:hypothetical protein
LSLVSIETKGRESRLQSRLKPKSTPGEISEMSGREVSRDLIGVNRRYELTPPQPIISMFYRADRRRDPTPNDTNSHRLQGSGACEVGKHLDLRGLPGGGGSPPKPVSYCRFPVYQGNLFLLRFFARSKWI